MRKRNGHEGMSSLDDQIASELSALFAEVPVGAEFGVHPSEDICYSLELRIPQLLSRRHVEWKHECLDGVFVARARKTGVAAAQLVGTCILMSDQTVTPLLVELSLSRSQTSIERFRVCLGEPGGGPLGISGPACNSRDAEHLLATVSSRLDLIAWAYRFTGDGH